MNFNGWGSFEDLLRSCGYTNSSDDNKDNINSNRSDCNNNNNNNNYGCSDIPNGFQTLHPELFIIIGELLGNIIAGSIPFNVQNAIGNWLQLVGQAIETYNAQQQYFQAGPGRYYDISNYNVVNPFCSPSTPPSTAAYTANAGNESNNSRTSSSTKTSKNKSNDSNLNRIQDLEKQVQDLTNELKEIKKLIQNK